MCLGGTTVAWMTVLLLIAEPLHRTGKFTLGDTVALRLPRQQRPVRVVLAVCVLASPSRRPRSCRRSSTPCSGGASARRAPCSASTADCSALSCRPSSPPSSPPPRAPSTPGSTSPGSRSRTPASSRSRWASSWAGSARCWTRARPKSPPPTRSSRCGCWWAPRTETPSTGRGGRAPGRSLLMGSIFM
ncbi:hypothetical protein ACF09Y_24190 [Streptomyces massasporeus]|uniref:hypothetical protein n=1 Tax=Streptomyces massasporeus TaxID=67324 RepID=UPI003702D1B1